MAKYIKKFNADLMSNLVTIQPLRYKKVNQTRYKNLVNVTTINIKYLVLYLEYKPQY